MNLLKSKGLSPAANFRNSSMTVGQPGNRQIALAVIRHSLLHHLGPGPYATPAVIFQ